MTTPILLRSNARIFTIWQWGGNEGGGWIAMAKLLGGAVPLLSGLSVTIVVTLHLNPCWWPLIAPTALQTLCFAKNWNHQHPPTMNIPWSLKTWWEPRPPSRKPQHSQYLETWHELVGSFKPSEKYESQLGLFFPIYGKIKNVPNHQPVNKHHQSWIPGKKMLLSIYLHLWQTNWHTYFLPKVDIWNKHESSKP